VKFIAKGVVKPRKVRKAVFGYRLHYYIASAIRK
jgi:hypothetical protein